MEPYRGRPKKHELVVNEAQRTELERMARQSRSARSVAFRARILLECAGGASNTAVAAKLRTTGFTVGLWRNRFIAEGVVGLGNEPRPGAPREIGDEKVEQVVRLNVVSPMLLTKYVLRSMLADGAGGRIVNLASIIAFTGYSGLSVYGATKASMIGFTRSLAREVDRTSVTVNAVAPGFVDTEMTKGLTEEHREQIVRRSALRRLVEVDDVAAAVEYLLSDGARNITGTVITVDAGNTA